MCIRTISAVIGEDDSFGTAVQAGYVGEHNADELRITLNTELGSDDYDYVALIFGTGMPDGCFSSNAVYDENSSPVYREGDVIVCPLSENLTSGGMLLVQAAAYKNDGADCVRVRKSGILTIAFRPSVMGSGSFLTASAGFENEVRSAVEAFRKYSDVWQQSDEYFHTHSNMDVLSRLGESGGSLTFDGTLTASAYTLPTASETVKGGVKQGFGLEMDDEKLSVSSNLFPVNAAYTACVLSGRLDISDTVVGSPAEMSCSDDENIGINENLYTFDESITKICYIPTDYGALDWYDFDGVKHTTNVSLGLIYVFSFDPESMAITVTACTPANMAEGNI